MDKPMNSEFLIGLTRMTQVTIIQVSKDRMIEYPMFLRLLGICELDFSLGLGLRLVNWISSDHCKVQTDTQAGQAQVR